MTMKGCRLSWIVGLALAVGPLGATAAGQAAKTPPARPAAQAPAPAAQAPAPAEAYTYNPEGRRDPFVSLVTRGGDLKSAGARPDGVAGMLINDVTVRGIVKSGEDFVAMLQAPDTKTYIVHVNDRLFDGSIKAITVRAVVFSQEVKDPLSLVKQREVRKPIRPLQEGK
jgi:type IV pilus assembly protein PilP